MRGSGRALAWSLAGFVAGVLCAAALPPWPVLDPLLKGAFVSIGLFAAIVLGGSVWGSAKGASGSRIPIRIDSIPRVEIGTTLLALIAGLALFSATAARQADRTWPAERAGEVHSVEGRVLGLPRSLGERTRLLLEVARGPEQLQRVELTWYRPNGWPRPGERWHFVVRLDAPSGRMNPGGWDRGRARFAQRIDAVGSIRSGRRIAAGGPGSALARFRQDASDWLQARIADTDAAALVRALAVGDRSSIGPELSERLRATGTAHLLAISGLHVGLVFGFGALVVGGLSTLVGIRWPWPERRRQAVFGGLIAALVYAALSGFALPTRRALLMLGVALGATLLRRPIAPGRSLLLALATVLALDPLAPLALGFWLSFAAVAVLVWAFAGRPGPGEGGAVGLVRAQLILGLGLLPLNLGLFHQWTPGALPANLLAIPLVAFFILPVSLLAVIGFAVGLPSLALAPLAGWCTARLVSMLDHFARWVPPTAIDWQPGLVEILLAGIGALWLLAPRGWPARSLGLALLLPLLLARSESLPPGGFDLHLLDLGDGQAAVIRTRTSTWLFGVGAGDGADSSQVPGSVAPNVRAFGGKSVDVIVVPGGDRDQSGGLAEARLQWPGARVLGRHPEVDARCTAGAVESIDGAEFRFLHPTNALPDQGSDDDCVLLVASAAGRVLLTGRVGAGAIRRLSGKSGPVTAVMAPRQGHRDGSNAGWWDELSPELALVSVERNNRWGLPHAEFRRVLAERAIPLFRTDHCGAISLGFRPGRALDLRTEVQRLDRWWRPAGRCNAP